MASTMDVTTDLTESAGQSLSRIGVLFISHTAHLGGAEIVLRRFLERVRGFRYMVIIPDGPFAEHLASHGIPFFTSKTLGNLRRAENVFWPLTFIYRFVLAQFELLYWIRSLRPEVIQCNNYNSVVYALLPAKLTGTPIVWHMHDYIRAEQGGRWLLRTMSASVAKIIAVSNAVRANLLDMGIQPDKIVTIYNAVDLVGETQSPPSEAQRFDTFARSFDMVIGLMGSITRLKGMREALEAFRLLVQEHDKNAGLMIAGQAISTSDRKYEQALRDSVVAYGLQERVRFLGQIRDTGAFYRSLDVFVHYPVLPDSLPTVILEAIWAGCPVMAANIGGNPECVGDGRWGRLVPPDDPVALARALAEGPIQRLAPDDLAAFRQRFSHDGKESQHLEIYRTIMR